MARIETCPEGHKLVLLCTARSGRCDSCLRAVMAEETVHDCRRCNWYLCDDCRPLASQVGNEGFWGAVADLFIHNSCGATPLDESAGTYEIPVEGKSARWKREAFAERTEEETEQHVEAPGEPACGAGSEKLGRLRGGCGKGGGDADASPTGSSEAATLSPPDSPLSAGADPLDSVSFGAPTAGGADHQGSASATSSDWTKVAGEFIIYNLDLQGLVHWAD